MNRIVISPHVFSSLAPQRKDTESSGDYLYLLREKYRPRKIIVSNLYEMIFGQKEKSKKEKKSEGSLEAEASYFSSYE